MLRMSVTNSSSGLTPMIAVLAIAHGNRSLLRFASANYQHVRHLLQLGIADFQIYLFTAIIKSHADPRRIQPVAYLLRIVHLLVGDGKHGGLHGREPDRKCSSIMLDENAKNRSMEPNNAR